MAIKLTRRSVFLVLKPEIELTHSLIKLLRANVSRVGAKEQLLVLLDGGELDGLFLHSEISDCGGYVRRSV